jgi:4-diphosphocytidyl-2C-methyl-D-erythritol kinase
MSAGLAGGSGNAAAVLQGNEQGIFIYQSQSVSLHQPIVQSLAASGIEVDNTFFIALAEHP